MNEPSAIPAKHQTRLRVRYAETDQMGVVHHANYIIWMEVGRVELVRSRGMSYREVEEQVGLYLSVVGVNCRYLAAARYDQELIIQTEVLSSNPRVVEFGYQILSAESDKLIAEGSTRHVWLNKQWRPTRLPEQYQHLLRVG